MSSLRPRLWVSVLFLHSLFIQPSWCGYASLSLATHLPATSNSSHEVTVNFTACAYYNPTYVPPPYQSYHRLDHFRHVVYPSNDQESNYGCSEISSNSSKASLQNSILLVDRGRCSFYKKAWLAQEQGASLLVVMFNKSKLPTGPRLIPTDMPNVTTPISIPVLFIMKETGQEIKNWVFNSTSVYLSGFVTSRHSYYLSFDPTIIVLFAIATATLIFSALLSYSGYKFIWYGLLFRPETNHMFTTTANSEPCSVASELYNIIKMLFVACVMLLLLYFFHTFTVSIMLLFYCMAAVLGLYHVLAPFAALIPFGNGEKFRYPRIRYTNTAVYREFHTFCGPLELIMHAWKCSRQNSYTHQEHQD